MKLQPTIVLGTFFCLIVVGYYGYLIFRSTQITVIAPPPVDDLAASAKIFDDPVFATILTGQVNGPIPIIPPTPPIGDDDPFQ